LNTETAGPFLSSFLEKFLILCGGSGLARMRGYVLQADLNENAVNR
jgi:hypothetical protein